MTSWRAGWRQRALGLATLLGATARGFFIPYRYADRIRSPDAYPALEPVFGAGFDRFTRQIAATARYLDTLAAFARPAPPPAPRFDQDWFPRLDAALAYALVRERAPARIVEIGAGHSTRFMARAIADGRLKTRLVAIDPAPRASLDGLPVEVVRTTIQAAPADLFAALQPGDMLFVDSSHILMPGSDVDWLLNTVVPKLAPGVIVHIHDVFLPDRYPTDWTWRGYNEQNAIAALVIGGAFRLVWSSHYVATRMAAEIAAAGLDRLPLRSGAYESSLWLERT